MSLNRIKGWIGVVASFGLATCGFSQQFSNPVLAQYGFGNTGDGGKKKTVVSVSYFPIADFKQKVTIDGNSSSQSYRAIGSLWTIDANFDANMGFIENVGLGGSFWSEPSDNRFGGGDKYQWRQFHVVFGLRRGWGVQVMFLGEVWPARTYKDRAIMVTKTFTHMAPDGSRPDYGVQLGAGSYFVDNGEFRDTNEVTFTYFINLSANLGGDWSAILSYWFARQDYVSTSGSDFRYDNRRIALGINKKI